MGSKNFQVTLRAKEDLRSIWEYTFDVWGEAKADNYISELYNRFKWLSHRPKTGKHRRDICEGYYCFPQGAHLVFYIINDNGIAIIGIPHKDMDILYYFNDE